MNTVKIIIEVKGGALQAVYSNTPLDYVLLDFDNLDAGDAPAEHVMQPDVVHPVLFELFDTDTPRGLEIREALKRLKF